MNTDLRKSVRNDSKKSFWTWWIRQFLEKTKENVTKHADI